MPSSLAPCLILLLAAAPPPVETGGDLASLVAAESAFARASVETDTREAFLAFLAEESLLFRPGPVPGRRATEERPALPGVLSWEPVAAEAAASGDLGWTTGPWTFTPEDGSAPAHGHYFSVWERRDGGPWKVLLDVGVSTPPPEAPIEGWKGGEDPARWTRPEGAGADLAAEEAALLARDREFSRDAGEGAEAAYLAHLAVDARLLREGPPPARGREAAREVVGEVAAVSWTPAAAGVAASGDLGFTYGTYELRREGQGGEEGHYLRAWRREPDGAWRVAVDLWLPQPPTTTEPQE